MPRSVMVSGRFIHRHGPAEGLIRFTPLRMWVVDGGVCWASLAPETRLARDGSFTALVTATDTDGIPWVYRVDCPSGTHYLHIPWTEVGYSLRELISGHRAGKSA